MYTPRLMNIVLVHIVFTGLRSWNVDLTVCDLNKELQLFETRHTAQFSAQVKGQSEIIKFCRCCFETRGGGASCCLDTIIASSELWWYHSLATYRLIPPACLQLWLQSHSDSRQIRLHSVCDWQYVLFPLHLFVPFLHICIWELQMIQPILIRLLYADCMSDWESMRAECDSEHYLPGRNKGSLRPGDRWWMEPVLMWIWLGCCCCECVCSLGHCSAFYKENTCVTHIYNDYCIFSVCCSLVGS